MLKRIGLPNLIFIILSVVLVGGVLLSFWVRSNLEVIEETPNTINPKGPPSGNDMPDINPNPTSDCVITGCSGQLCAESETPSTCEFREEYACYKNALCERQQDGKCGWTMTGELQSCLKNAGSSSGSDNL